MSRDGRWVDSLPAPVASPLRSAKAAASKLEISFKRQALQRTSARITEGFPMFAPMSRGPWPILASLTVQSAHQTFPLMLELLSSTGIKIEDPTPVGMFARTEAEQDAALRIKVLFDQYGSDKSAGHDYHLLYGPLLESRGASAVLEIGLGTNNDHLVSHMTSRGKPGASLRAFRDFLPGGQIYGATWIGISTMPFTRRMPTWQHWYSV
jgi:hypothetical protein